MGEDFPSARTDLLGVDGDDDALRAELLRRLAHEVPVRHGGRVDRRLVGAGEQEIANIVERAHAAADGQRHETGFRRALHDIEQNAAIFMARGNVEKAQLVGAGGVIGDGAFHRIAGVAQIDEIHALDDATLFHVETGDDAGFEHYAILTRRLARICAQSPNTSPLRGGRRSKIAGSGVRAAMTTMGPDPTRPRFAGPPSP